jgi:hypothetical protein
VGCRLLVYRYTLSEEHGDANIPLNVIDLTSASIQQMDSNVISITTYREYEFSFANQTNAHTWYFALLKARNRGLSLVEKEVGDYK